MPYAQRNADGRITSLHREATSAAAEELPLDHPDVLAFLDASPRAGDEFARLDASFVRVIEDLIDTLIAKNLINLTDLPEQAQSKLLSRKTFRERAARDALKLFGDGGDGLIRTPPESSS